MALPARAARLAVLVVSFAALVCDPALAADSLKQSGVVIDKRPVVDAAHWSISESSATWDTPGYTGKYTWSIPSSIPAAGANASLTVTSTDKSGGRYNGVISATADMTIEGTAQAQALADKNGGQATASDTATFKLVPGSYSDTATPSVTVFVQDGPHVTFQYKVDAPPCSVAARFSAEGAADDPNCKLGKLPIGKQVGVDTPEPGKAKNVSPTAIPPETYNLILEILAEQEAERLAAALAAKFGATEAKDLIAGCFVVVQGGFAEDDPPTFDWFGNIINRNVKISSEGKTAIFNACARLLLSPSPPAPPADRARVAATGCHVITVPVFEKGTKVTKRRRKQARAAILEQVKPSCDDKQKGFTASLKARGKGATLNRVTGKNIGAPLTRLSNTPANGRRTSVRWKAVKR